MSNNDNTLFGQLTLPEPEPTIDASTIKLNRALTGFLAGYSGTTLDAYRLDLRQWIVRRLAKRAGTDKRISPHSLRHSFITAALDAGVPLRDVQEAASHSDPRTTMRYDRGRGSLDRHATYIVSTFVAGASR